MQETDNSNIQEGARVITMNHRTRLVIRISKQSLSFAAVQPSAETTFSFEPYTVKSGISMAANIREAFRNVDLLAKQWDRVMVVADTEALLIPIDEYQQEDQETLYHHAFTHHQGDKILSTVLPSLSAVMLYSMNKDLLQVIEDHFPDVRYTHVCAPVWQHFHRRSFTGMNRKLYGYFHDKKVDIFAFTQNRFRFYNRYDTNNPQDAVYFLLYVWKQLGMDQQKDELYISGQLPEGQTLIENLQNYLRKAYTVNPSAEFNRAPLTQIKGMPYDLITLFLNR